LDSIKFAGTSDGNKSIITVTINHDLIDFALSKIKGFTDELDKNGGI